MAAATNNMDSPAYQHGHAKFRSLEFDAVVSKVGNPANRLVIPQIGEETLEANI